MIVKFFFNLNQRSNAHKRSTMPCSHCHQTGHNIRTCPALKAVKYSPLERTVSEAPHYRFHEKPVTKSDCTIQDKVFDSLFYPGKKLVHFSEDLIHSSITIPDHNTGKKVKHTPSRPRVRSGKSKSVLRRYCLASQGSESSINIVMGWKKYC